MAESFPGQASIQGLHIGVITDVTEETREYTVKTLRSDLILPRAKLMHQAWHKDGDESVAMLRIGTYVLVGFIDSKTSIILGVWPTGLNTSVQNSKHKDLQAGDYLQKVESGAYQYMSVGGLIEAYSTVSCWWMMNPNEHRFSLLANNYELNVSGGLMFWNVDKSSKDTLYHFVAIDNIEPTMGCEIQIGSLTPPDSDGSDEEDVVMPVVDIGIGETSVSNKVEKKNAQISVYSDGKTVVNIGQGNVVFTITPDGKVDVYTKSNVTAKVDGDLSVDVVGMASIKTRKDASVTVGGKADVNVTGATNVTSGGTATVQAPKIILNKEGSGITTKNSHQGVIDMILGIPVSESQTVFSDV